LAVAALEDKIVQRATVAVLNCIYKEEFLGFSYGFRPKRGQHDALDALAVGITDKKVNFILDADVRSFFDEAEAEAGRTRDFLGYGRQPPDPRWPNAAHVAVNFVINYEEGGEYSVPDGDPVSEAALTEGATAAVPARRP
jgi:hypothetical protein